MKLTFRVFGFEVSTLELDLPDAETEAVELVAPVVSRGVKWLSKHWVRGMIS